MSKAEPMDCVVCGTNFTPGIRSPIAKYCSGRCRMTALRRRRGIPPAKTKRPVDELARLRRMAEILRLRIEQAEARRAAGGAP
jgi:hypothetical protein